MSVGLSIDGMTVAADPQSSILDAAVGLGIEIPTLCHDPRIAPETSCWVCVVEVKRGEEWRIEPSCATRVSDGMAVRTDSEAIRAARRTAIELIMSEHDADCVAPCVLACPASVDVPRYITAVRQGRFTDAAEVVRETNPLPGVCGRVCTHPCESVCTRGLVDAPVAINPIKRLAVERAEDSRRSIAAETGKRVAIIGAGPAGLSAAYYLRLAGHRVSVLDSRQDPGGMLRYAIPAYRLPRDVLDADVRTIQALGVELRLAVELGPHIVLSELLGEGARDPHDAVFLAMGAWRQRRLGIPNEYAEGVLGSLDLLRWTQEGQIRTFEGDVAILGGGNSAVDAARTAKRLGARRVTIYYRRGREHMPAFSAEIEAALEEGVELECYMAPIGVELANGRASGIQLTRMRLGDPDGSGRPRPVAIPGSEHVRPAQWIVSAVGELADPIASRGLVDPRTQATPIVGLFAGGDFVSGPSTVVEAIASGRRAAVAIDRYLRGEKVGAPTSPSISSRRSVLRVLDGSDFDHVPQAPRALERAIPLALRTSAFREVTLGLSAAEAQQEAARCLECGCSAFLTCKLRPLLSTYQTSPARYRGAVHGTRARSLRSGLELDPNKCIRCHRCVSICRDVAGASVLTFSQRGFATSLEYLACSDGIAKTACDTCMAQNPLCVDTCPTGALIERKETQDGATQDGATRDGATQDGATQDGATQDGATQDGATRQGETQPCPT